MTRSKSRRTRRNRRRRGGHSRGFAGEEGWITEKNQLKDLTTPGGCAMMLGKRIGLIARSGFGGEYGKIDKGDMKGYDGEKNNKGAMMKFNLACDKGNGEKQLKTAWAKADFNTRAEFLKTYGDFDVVATKEEVAAKAAKAEAAKAAKAAAGGRRRKKSRKKRRKSRRKSRRKRKKSRKQRRRR